MLWLAGTVTGNVIPPSEYPDPFQSAEETVMSELPAVNVPVCVAFEPTATFPKFIVDGLTPS